MERMCLVSISGTFVFEAYTQRVLLIPLIVGSWGWRNMPLVVERAYCVSASAHLVDGSLNPQIMETWGWMASLIESKCVV